MKMVETQDSERLELSFGQMKKTSQKVEEEEEDEKREEENVPHSGGIYDGEEKCRMARSFQSKIDQSIDRSHPTFHTERGFEKKQLGRTLEVEAEASERLELRFGQMKMVETQDTERLELSFGQMKKTPQKVEEEEEDEKRKEENVPHSGGIYQGEENCCCRMARSFQSSEASERLELRFRQMKMVETQGSEWVELRFRQMKMVDTQRSERLELRFWQMKKASLKLDVEASERI